MAVWGFARLLFFRGLGEVFALSGPSEQTGDELISHLLEGVMDGFFQVGESSGVVLQGLQPLLGLALQTLVNLDQGGIEAGQGGCGGGVDAHFHQ